MRKAARLLAKAKRILILAGGGAQEASLEVTLLSSMLAHVRAHAPGIRLEAARIDGDTECALESVVADLFSNRG